MYMSENIIKMKNSLLAIFYGIYIVNAVYLVYCYFVANLLLQDTVERIHVGKQYGDIPRGIFLVRGENMVLCGEIVSLD